MTALRDPFEKTHSKKTDWGEAEYVSWSQVADRLDDAAPEQWSFTIIALGPDWCHGRLTIGVREFDNIGYAEHADASWKKEIYKDAVSDALRRCAAMAGVARYLYEKERADDSSRHGASQSTGRGTPLPRPAARPTLVSDDLYEFGDEEPGPRRASGSDNSECPEHGVKWNGEWGDLWHKTEDGKYCRHPENTRQEGRQRAGARR